jgi:glycosyltransferase involved in cell wall biosynthesis
LNRKVKLIIDPGHSGWILGGLFQEISEFNSEFFSEPVKIYNLRNIRVVKSIILVLSLTLKKSPIFFSSITPLQNYLKMNPFRTNTKILWYTHFEEVPDKKIIKIINKCNLVFVHSEKLRDTLISLGVTSKIVSMVGAINASYFRVIPTAGERIAWIGTAVSRKNPEILLKFAEQNLDLKFKILGKNWKDYEKFYRFNQLPNVEYVEIHKQIKSHDLDTCSHFLMLSSAEGGPMSLLEALASGLIPICTSVGIAPELLPKIGYAKQLLSGNYTLESIRQKYEISYSNSHRLKASEFVKSFTVNRLSLLIQKEIENYHSR